MAASLGDSKRVASITEAGLRQARSRSPFSASRDAPAGNPNRSQPLLITKADKQLKPLADIHRIAKKLVIGDTVASHSLNEICRMAVLLQLGHHPLTQQLEQIGSQLLRITVEERQGVAPDRCQDDPAVQEDQALQPRSQRIGA